MERLLFSEQKRGSTTTTKGMIMRNGLNTLQFVACATILLIFFPDYAFAWNSEMGMGYFSYVAIVCVVIMIMAIYEFIKGNKKGAQSGFTLVLCGLIILAAGFCFYQGHWVIGVILIPIAIMVGLAAGNNK